VEPVFGLIKVISGYRRFLLRGPKVRGEWSRQRPDQQRVHQREHGGIGADADASDTAATVTNRGFLTNVRAASPKSCQSRSSQVHPHISRTTSFQNVVLPNAHCTVCHFRIATQFALQIVLAPATPSPEHLSFPRPAT